MTNQELLQLATQTAQKAYAPYSNFKVGAAVLLENGTVYTGNNQENASYGLTVCAERVAINFALAQEPQAKVVAIAVAGISTQALVTPCGACRQVLAEVANRQKTDFKVIMHGEKEGITTQNVSELLPLSFSL